MIVNLFGIYFHILEIPIIICLCFLYVNSERRLYFLYWVLFGSGFLFIMAVFMRILKGETYLLAFRVFPGYEAVFSFAMVLPFLNRGKNKFIWVLIGICLLSILLSLSRGAWLAWLLCILYGFSFLKEKPKKHMKK